MEPLPVMACLSAVDWTPWVWLIPWVLHLKEQTHCLLLLLNTIHCQLSLGVSADWYFFLSLLLLMLCFTVFYSVYCMQIKFVVRILVHTRHCNKVNVEQSLTNDISVYLHFTVRWWHFWCYSRSGQYIWTMGSEKIWNLEQVHYVWETVHHYQFSLCFWQGKRFVRSVVWHCIR